jgi:ethanolaminephosphotransferase
MGIYIRNGHLNALQEYRYAGQDKSLVSKYLLNPFWTRLAARFPATMAPNAITLTGFLFVVLNFVTLLVYTPTLRDPCPPWVYLSWAVGLFLYQAFDAIDGKQARRLGLSGPLGECFDHGVDALNTTVAPPLPLSPLPPNMLTRQLEVILFAAATGLGQSWATLFSQFGSTSLPHASLLT